MNLFHHIRVGFVLPEYSAVMLGKKKYSQPDFLAEQLHQWRILLDMFGGGFLSRK